ncbi:MAG: potassium-transporting ATPase subunit KdpC [bacterium]
MKEFIKSLKAFILFSILLGLIYPAFITIVTRLTLPYKANGSLIVKGNETVGSVFIGQLFTDNKYFQSRPSAVDYNASGSGGSNYGPSNKKFIEVVEERINSVKAINGITENSVPADMVLASASGLDPHISPENAMMQVKRVAGVRGIPTDKVIQLVNNNIDKDFLGIWGCPGVNVLKLNIAVDELESKYKMDTIPQGAKK